MTGYSGLIIRGLVCICLVLALIFTIFIVFFSEDSDRLTYDISDYNTEDYPIYAAPFPKIIPEDAEVVKFVWYNYYHEDWEYYLELKFDSVDAFNAFLDETFEQANKFQSSLSNDSGERMTMQPNPYNPHFTDCFSWERWTSTKGNYYTGYEVEWCNDKGLDYDCQYCIISYSLVDLTVIITAASGIFHYSTNKVPEYFIRFEVPTEPVDRMILIG